MRRGGEGGMENGRGGCEEGNWRKWGEGKEKKGEERGGGR